MKISNNKFSVFILKVIDRMVDFFVMESATTLCIILCFFNWHWVLWIPITFLIDFLIVSICMTNQYLYNNCQMENILTGFASKRYKIHEFSHPELEKIDTEIKKYPNYRFGNVKGLKSFRILQVENTVKLDGLSSIAESFGESVIFVPRDAEFDLNDIKYQTFLAHEYAHCLDHDMYLLRGKRIRITTIIVVCISLIFLFFVRFALLPIVLIAVSLIIFGLQKYMGLYKEIEANHVALQVIDSLYGDVKKELCAEILLCQLLSKLKDLYKCNARVKIMDYWYLYFQILHLENYIQNKELIEDYESMSDPMLEKICNERINKIRKRPEITWEPDIHIRPYNPNILFLYFISLVLCGFLIKSLVPQGIILSSWVYFASVGLFLLLITILNIKNLKLCQTKITLLQNSLKNSGMK